MLYDITYMQNLIKNDAKNIYKTETEPQMQKINLQLSEENGEEINRDTESDIHTLLYIKQTTRKDLLDNTGNSTQDSVMTYVGEESEKEQTYVYVQLTHFAVQLTHFAAHLKLTL